MKLTLLVRDVKAANNNVFQGVSKVVMRTETHIFSQNSYLKSNNLQNIADYSKIEFLV